jgi:nicotinate-nucleotide adenylyltransferase
MRLAIFGGTFDPVHRAHVEVAVGAAERFELDQVWLIPNHQPPHKGGQTIAAYEHRLRMVQEAVAGHPRLRASDLEREARRSYSIETIEAVRRLHPEARPLYFLIGADAFNDVGTWHRWREVVESVEFLVVSRPGFLVQAPEGARRMLVEGFDFDLSSSGIRQALAEGRAADGLNPRVAAYIAEHRLYGVV